MKDKPQTVAVRAGDVKPYEWAQWCRIEDSEPFANEIVSVCPADDGVHLWFMLDSHNFLKAHPEEVLDLIPVGRPAFVRTFQPKRVEPDFQPTVASPKFVLALADRIFAAHEVLANRAERREVVISEADSCPL
jgi:hypothetical protein